MLSTISCMLTKTTLVLMVCGSPWNPLDIYGAQRMVGVVAEGSSTGRSGAVSDVTLASRPSTAAELVPPIMRQVHGLADDDFPSNGGWAFGWTPISGWNFEVIESTHLRLADIDSDGDLDVFVASRGLNRYFLNDGVGHLTKVQSGHFVLDPGNSEAIAVGDLNGDGHVDVVVANDGANALYLGDGDGTLTKVRRGDFATPGDSKAIEVADIDNDGDLDVFVANQDRANFLHLNDGAAGLSRVVPTNSSVFGGDSDVPATALAVGDINNDGHLDVLVGNAAGHRNAIYKNDGHGVLLLQHPRLYGATNSSRLAANTTDLERDGFNSASSAESDAVAIALADVDTDGDLDVVLANGGGFPGAVFSNDGYGVMTRLSVEAAGDFAALTSSAGSGGFVVADFDMDGNPDIAFGCGQGLEENNSMWLNNGTGRFDRVIQRQGDQYYDPFHSSCGGPIVGGDIDGDGDVDLLLATYHVPMQANYQREFNTVVDGRIINNSVFLNDGMPGPPPQLLDISPRAPSVGFPVWAAVMIVCCLMLALLSCGVWRYRLWQAGKVQTFKPHEVYRQPEKRLGDTVQLTDVDRHSYDRMLDQLADAKRKTVGPSQLNNVDPHSRTYRGPHKGRPRVPAAAWARA